MSDIDENDLILDPDLVVSIEPIELTTEQLQEKIKTLSTTSEGEDLRFAMRDLKKALLANPSACALLGPEDIGEMVKHLKRMIGPELEKADSKKAVKAAKEVMGKVKKLSEINFAELEDDDV
jgi:hypothetical protein